MPVLPHLFTRNASPAADTRILDSRQLLDAAQHATHAIATGASELVKRIPKPQLSPRQDGGIYLIQEAYAGLNAGPSPGVVVGIVLGSVGGFLLVIWLLWILSQGTTFFPTSVYEEEDIDIRRRSRSRHSHRSRRVDMVERSPRRDRVIRTERIIRENMQPREASRLRERERETMIVEDRSERRVDGDDIVEVIEEHESVDVPAPRRKSRRGSTYRTVEQTLML